MVCEVACIDILLSQKSSGNSFGAPRKLAEKRKRLFRRDNQANNFSAFGVSLYVWSICSTSSALTSSLSPLLTLNKGCPVCSETVFGVKAPFFMADSVAIPLLVGFPSGDTQGIPITAS
jgi:hypothetical protein